MHMPIQFALLVLPKPVGVVELAQIFPPVEVCKGTNYFARGCRVRWQDVIANSLFKQAIISQTQLLAPHPYRWVPAEGCVGLKGEN